MPDLILHHYPLSPFAEKVRSMLGYKNLPWQSVLIPMVMPKPDVLALTGGYRKTPVLQIGADMYCDTALIADVLEHLQPKSTLYPEPFKGLARTLAQWGDSTFFWAAMAYNMQPRGLAQIFANTAPEALQAFREDRGAMSAGMMRLRPADAAVAYKSYLRRISDMLDLHPFLLGETPCIADFAVYSPLWFTRKKTPVLSEILSFTPAVQQWLDRMESFGHGTPQELSSTAAIAMAAKSTPLALRDDIFQDEHGIPLGSRVTVSAETFGSEPTEGTLIAATRLHYSLRRTDPRAGTVHVHFPRIGYALKAVAVG
jgi:glutathione S-transferase